MEQRLEVVNSGVRQARPNGGCGAGERRAELSGNLDADRAGLGDKANGEQAATDAS